MHCETTVDPSGNWKQSWNALERAYAEGTAVTRSHYCLECKIFNNLDNDLCAMHPQDAWLA